MYSHCLQIRGERPQQAIQLQIILMNIVERGQRPDS